MKLAFSLVVLLGGLLLFLRASAAALPVRRFAVGKTVFSVEVADTAMSRMKGLSGHAPLGVKEGMLFVFPRPSSGAFWMQGMLFPLDFVWVNNGKVVGVTEDARPMKETGYRLYPPPQPVDRVLELNAGAVRKFKIKKGDMVSYKE